MRDIAADSAGNVFVLGSQSLTNWIVLKGRWTGAAMDWAEVDKLDPSGGDTLSPRDIAIRFGPPGGKDELWTVCRRYNSVDKSYTVLFRRSMDGGTTWSPAGQMDNTTFRPARLALGQDGAVYVTGHNPKIAGETYRSVNGGSNWFQVDAFPGDYMSRAMVITPPGQPFVAMWDVSSAGERVIRTSPNGDPGTWNDSGVSGWSAEALTVDSKGNVFAAGGASTNGIIAKLAAPQPPALEFNRF